MGHGLQISNFQQVGAAFAACRTYGDKGAASLHRFLPRPSRQRGFGFHLIAAVDHCIHRLQRAGLGKNSRPIFGRDEIVYAQHAAVGRVTGDAQAHSLNFGHAYGRVGGVDLAVDIRFGDMVHIHQRDAAHAAARQTFSRPRTHAAYADHQHMGSAYVRRAIHTIKPCQTAKAAVFVYCRTQGFICLARAGLRNGLSNLPAVF